jgi:hypothetical protein
LWIAHVAVLGLVFLYWGIFKVQLGPCTSPACASVNVSMVASLAASGCLMLGAVNHWPRPLLAAALGASVVAVVAAFVVGWDLILPVLTILLTILPTWSVLTWWSDS